MNILLSGITGYMGSALVPRLQRDGHVVALHVAPCREDAARHVDLHRDEQDQPAGGKLLQVDLGRVEGREAGRASNAAHEKIP